MKPAIRRLRGFAPGLFSLLWLVQAASGATPEFSAVASKVFNGYVRPTEADGSYRTETYAFGEGGRYNSVVAGDSIDVLPFPKLAQILKHGLESVNYQMSRDPEKTDLMIMVYWGTTLKSRADNGYPVPAKALVENFNAKMLGFTDAVDDARALDFTTHAQDILNEFERPRYFVVLRAYDFPLAYKQKKLKLLWETRFSILTQGNDFTESLPIMVRDASRYFGKQSDGLAWPPVPEGRVRLGDTQYLPDQPKSESKSPETPPASRK